MDLLSVFPLSVALLSLCCFDFVYDGPPYVAYLEPELFEASLYPWFLVLRLGLTLGNVLFLG